MPQARVTAASLVTAPAIRPAKAAAPEPATTAAAPAPAAAVIKASAEAAAPERPRADPELRQRVALRKIAAAGAAFDQGPRTVPARASAEELQISSLEGGLAAITSAKVISADQIDRTQRAPQQLSARPFSAQPLAAQPSAAGPAGDVRTILGTRVNMRMGPGTSFPVITQVTAGDQVTVFESSGTGWLRLRAGTGGQVGWIASSLVSAKRP